MAERSDMTTEALGVAPLEPAASSSKKEPTDPEVVFKELTRNLGAYLKDHPLDVVQKAYHFAARAHKDQFRRSGEPYITHPLAVANILTSLRLDLGSIVAAILHDTVEDTDVTLEQIEAEFGKDVRELVDGLTKIGKIQFRSSQERLAENFRKMVLAMASDLRVILVKLADRLHNMRTLDNLPQVKRQRIAEETLEIYAPLANRLGLYSFKSELEDLCMRELKNDLYKDLARKVAAKKAERERYIDEVRNVLENELSKYGFQNLHVYGRPKHFYSIYKKMVERTLEFEDVHDLFAFRIIVDSVKDCYEALGIVHAMWKPMPGRFKDYIAMPKANLYQSLHTTVIRPNGEPCEIQIRTHEMHQTCELGVAAHWAYKEKGARGTERPGTPGALGEGKDDLQKFSWLRQIMEWQKELKDPDEFLEAVKVDLFEEEIFVFTPKGDVFQLAMGATALDFAFAVHTKVGAATVGAKVNGRMVPIKKTLKSGDIVEILTSPHQKPGKDWLNFVTTAKARNKIRSWLRTEQRDRSRTVGREILEQELTAVGLDFEKMTKNGEMDHLVRTGKESNVDDLLIAIGYGKLNPKDVIARAFPQKTPRPTLASAAGDGATQAVREAQEKAQRSGGRDSGHHGHGERGHATGAKGGEPPRTGKASSSGILVHGIENVLINFARCCHPLPGEDVVGFITRGRGVTVHRGSCPRALDIDPQRRVDVQWAQDAEAAKGAHAAFLRVTAQDRPGVLAEVTSAISACGANIQRAQIRVTAELTGVLEFEMTLQSLTQLQAIIRKLESTPNVLKVERMSTHRINK
jgi:GTP pyrophosphokinase